MDPKEPVSKTVLQDKMNTNGTLQTGDSTQHTQQTKKSVSAAKSTNQQTAEQNEIQVDNKIKINNERSQQLIADMDQKSTDDLKTIEDTETHHRGNSESDVIEITNQQTGQESEIQVDNKVKINNEPSQQLITDMDQKSTDDLKTIEVEDTETHHRGNSEPDVIEHNDKIDADPSQTLSEEENSLNLQDSDEPGPDNFIDVVIEPFDNNQENNNGHVDSNEVKLEEEKSTNIESKLDEELTDSQEPIDDKFGNENVQVEQVETPMVDDNFNLKFRCRLHGNAYDCIGDDNKQITLVKQISLTKSDQQINIEQAEYKIDDKNDLADIKGDLESLTSTPNKINYFNYCFFFLIFVVFILFMFRKQIIKYLAKKQKQKYSRVSDFGDGDIDDVETGMTLSRQNRKRNNEGRASNSSSATTGDYPSCVQNILNMEHYLSVDDENEMGDMGAGKQKTSKRLNKKKNKSKEKTQQTSNLMIANSDSVGSGWDDDDDCADWSKEW